MTITFTIIKSRQKLKNQWKYLVKRGSDRFDFLKNFFLILIIATGVYLLLYFFIPINYFIVLKGVGAATIVLGWVVIILFSIFLYFRNIKNNWRLKKFLNTISSDQLSYDVQINNEYVKIISGQNVTELPWIEFTGFGINNDTIYVFNEVKAINSLYWDRDEMGNDSYLALINFLNQKAIKQTF